ncbi:MAG TPA: nuclear transport factor 2 family protein [Chitinophagaceae bacterium]|nr:nuclear transport factor 2 family protein [Chitinophagaceae bacterium]
MRSFFIALTSLLLPALLKAQTAEDSVKAVIEKMFKCMQRSDAEGLRSVFADSAILQTISRNKEGKVFVRTDRKDDFIAFVGKQNPGAADERISFETVKVDGPLALAWTPYQFYFNGQFSHCGVNSFQLVRLEGLWKIQYLIDTRRRNPCGN